MTSEIQNSESGLSVRTKLNEVIVDVNALNFEDGLLFNTVTQLLADTSLTYASGNVVAGNYVLTRSEGFSYLVAASSATDQHVTTAGGVKLYVQAVDGALPVAAFAVVGTGSDDSVAFQKAVNAAAALDVMVVDVPAGDFIVNNLSLPSGVWLRGVGYERQVGGGVQGTNMLRTSNVPILTMTGVSSLSGGPMHTNARVSGIYFDGDDLSADIWQMDAVATANVWQCMWIGTSGRWVRMREVFDSRFTDCRFEYGGSADGSVAGIDMISDDGGFEATNQIHFTSCVCESFPGTAIRGRRVGTSYDTNEIYFTMCKVESRESSTFLVDLQNCVGIHFNLMQLAGKGTVGQTPAAMMRLQNCLAVSGDVHAEVFGTTYASWQSYVQIVTSRNINLRLTLYGVVMSSMPSAVNHDASGLTSCMIQVMNRAIVPRNTNISTVLSSDGLALITARPGLEPSLTFQSEDIAGESWTVGRVVVDGAASKLRIFHNSTSAVEVTADNTLWPRAGLRVGAAYNGGYLLRMDAWRFWIDAQGRLRLLNGFPSTDDAGNTIHTNANGATGSRPASPVTGQQFYDTTLSKPIWWSGTNWRDAASTVV